MPDLEPRRATLRDVAVLAGVSYQTVSRVVNRKPSVAPSTREKVLAAIRDLNYSPNPAAQVLNTGRSHILQLVIFSSVYGRSVSSMVQEAHSLGYTLAITELMEPQSAEVLRERLQTTTRMADGLLLMLPYGSLSADDLVAICDGRPFVVVGRPMGAEVSSVYFDQYEGARQAVGHLLSLGHRRIAEITGSLNHTDVRAWHDAFLDALMAHGLQPAASVEGDLQAASGFAAAELLLDGEVEFTALLVSNDRMALGAIRALREHGLRVPEDVSVVGLEDARESAYYEPPLTTVRQDFDGLGRQCVDDMVSLIEEPGRPARQCALYPELVVRQSVALCDGAEPAGDRI